MSETFEEPLNKENNNSKFRNEDIMSAKPTYINPKDKENIRHHRNVIIGMLATFIILSVIIENLTPYLPNKKWVLITVLISSIISYVIIGGVIGDSLGKISDILKLK